MTDCRHSTQRGWGTTWVEKLLEGTGDAIALALLAVHWGEQASRAWISRRSSRVRSSGSRGRSFLPSEAQQIIQTTSRNIASLH